MSAGPPYTMDLLSAATGMCMGDNPAPPEGGTIPRSRAPCGKALHGRYACDSGTDTDTTDCVRRPRHAASPIAFPRMAWQR